MEIDTDSLEHQFAVKINKLMYTYLIAGCDRTQMAYICENTARELFHHYGVGEDYDNYREFVADTEFLYHEIEEKLDEIDEMRKNNSDRSESREKDNHDDE